MCLNPHLNHCFVRCSANSPQPSVGPHFWLGEAQGQGRLFSPNQPSLPRYPHMSFFCLDLVREAQLSVRGGGGAEAGPLESPSLAPTCGRTSACDANPDRGTPGTSVFNDAGKQGWSEACSSPPSPWKLPRAETHALRWSNQAYIVFRLCASVAG